MNNKPIELNIPAVPNIAFKVINLINDENVSLKKLEEIILADPALTAKILRIANSAFYGLRSRVTTIVEAINIMGFKTLKDVVIMASIKEIYKVFGLIEKMLWEHGVGVAVVAGILTDYVSVIKKDEANMAGLLHDIGKVVINNNFSKEYANCYRIVHEKKIPFEEVEKDFFGYDHCDVGGMLAEKWGFPESLKSAIVNHHNFDFTKDCEDFYEKSLLLVISLADSICTRLGVGFKESMPELLKNEKEIMDILGINEKDYSNIANMFIDSFPDYLESFMD